MSVNNEILWQVEINPQTGMIIAERELLDRYVAACRLQLPQVIPLSFHGRWKSVG
ncbi:hypothetical protein MC7420_6440 [Coleofasciculus chthonoplastes PCC 7420]|uniref:Uncharacterized protein n=1 Tax=Coleofasciculus chthonoplastes PCC 7420 TaxID=118168 RepID=B4VQA3_9CYAN|nr:hypothetical protein [Coleofasciculus chthonoplastes]EDX75785.1 hypothetical protein MC7420_6440 [Coleofasciculus chthonoplastes PCC 7420]